MEVVLNIFGELSIQRGNEFTFLGIYIEITDNGRVKIVIKLYIQDIINMFPGVISQPVISAAKRHLLEVIKYCDKVLKEESETFHSTVENIL